MSERGLFICSWKMKGNETEMRTFTPVKATGGSHTHTTWMMKAWESDAVKHRALEVTHRSFNRESVVSVHHRTPVQTADTAGLRMLHVQGVSSGKANESSSEGLRFEGLSETTNRHIKCPGNDTERAKQVTTTSFSAFTCMQ